MARAAAFASPAPKGGTTACAQAGGGVAPGCALPLRQLQLELPRRCVPQRLLAPLLPPLVRREPKHQRRGRHPPISTDESKLSRCDENSSPLGTRLLETFHEHRVGGFWWAMQGSNLRPSVCKASEPERCATDSTPLSENAEVIIWKSPAANEARFHSRHLPMAGAVADVGPWRCPSGA
jgi:hypothetical protein